MAKKCEISGTGVMSGNNVSHANPPPLFAESASCFSVERSSGEGL